MKQKTIIIGIIIALIVSGIVYFVLKASINNQNPVQAQRGYHLDFTNDFSKVIAGTPVTLTFSVQDQQGNILKNFQLEHTKLLHFIVIRKDLQEFQHIHPDLNPTTGEFSITMTFPTDGPYRLFADFAPLGAPMEMDGMVSTTVIYQDVSIGNVANYTPQAVTPDTQTTKSFEGLDITFTFPQQITANTATNFSLHITKNGKPITDLQDYLGAASHVIILGENTLSYMHIHAVDKNGHMASVMGSMPGMDMGDW